MNTKGQMTIEALIIFGLLVLGALILGAFYFSAIKPQSTDIQNEFKINSSKVFKDELNKNYFIYPPLSSQASGTVPSGTEVILSTTVSNAIIRYTINGTEPTYISVIYSVPFIITEDITIKAKTYKTGYEPSETATFQYNVD